MASILTVNQLQLWVAKIQEAITAFLNTMPTPAIPIEDIQTLKEQLEDLVGHKLPYFTKYCTIVDDEIVNKIKDCLKELSVPLYAGYSHGEELPVIKILEELNYHGKMFARDVELQTNKDQYNNLLNESNRIQTDYQRNNADLSKKLTDFQSHSTELSKELEGLRESIRQRKDAELKETAIGTYMADAQEQFERAAGEQKERIDHWTKLSYWCIGLLISFLIIFLVLAWVCPLQSDNIGVLVYNSVIRFMFLGIFGALATFSIKMMRSYIHMRELNLHRKRLINCLPAITFQAEKPDNKDMISVHAADAIISFGDTGILNNGDDSINAVKALLDRVIALVGRKS